MLENILNGLLKIFAWLLSRPTLRVRVSADNAEEEVGGLKFEAENISNETTSLSPSIVARFVTVERETSGMVFDVRELDRSLPPFTPKTFSASARESQPERHHAWFRTYTFSPTKGRARRTRIRNASLEQIGIVRFWVERLWFQLTGRLFGVKSSMTMEEYRAQQRSRGPH